MVLSMVCRPTRLQGKGLLNAMLFCARNFHPRPCHDDRAFARGEMDLLGRLVVLHEKKSCLKLFGSGQKRWDCIVFIFKDCIANFLVTTTKPSSRHQDEVNENGPPVSVATLRGLHRGQLSNRHSGCWNGTGYDKECKCSHDMARHCVR